MIYLASPYSNQSAYIRERRFQAVCSHAADLIKDGHVVFCPIAHSHPISHFMPQEKNNWETWKPQDETFLRNSDILIVLMLGGWEESIGVQDEIKIAEEEGIPIHYALPKPEWKTLG